MQLVCPAGNLPALKAAIEHGADAVYVGFRDQTNARAFPGLNFSDDELRAGVGALLLHPCGEVDRPLGGEFGRGGQADRPVAICDRAGGSLGGTLQIG